MRLAPAVTATAMAAIGVVMDSEGGGGSAAALSYH